MEAIEQARLKEMLIEQYMPLAEQLAQAVISSGMNRRVFSDGCSFATTSLNTVNIIDWFKRRTAVRQDFREVGPRIVKALLDIRGWAKAQTEDIQEQSKLMAEFLALIQGYITAIQLM